MRPLFLASMILICAGCKLDPRQRIVGNWMADQTKTELPQTPFPQYEKQFKRLMSSARVKFSADGTAVFTGPVPIEGTWAYEEGKVRLVPKDGQMLERMPFAEKEVVFEVDPKFEYLTWKLESPFGPVMLVLKKTG